MSPRPKFLIRPASYDDAAISPDVADRDLTEAILGVLQELVQDLSKKWDMPPLCGLLYLRGRTPVGDPVPMHTLAMDFVPLAPLTKWLVETSRVHYALVALAEVFQREAPPDMTPEDLVAIVLINEAWYAYVPADNPAEVKRMEEAGRKRELHSYPGRVEVKQAVAVDINGTVYLVNKPRGEKSQYMAGPAMSKWAIHGDVPNGLEYLLLSFQQKTLPPFEDWWEANRDYNAKDWRAGPDD
jgi:hypothetical protein